MFTGFGGTDRPETSIDDSRRPFQIYLLGTREEVVEVEHQLRDRPVDRLLHVHDLGRGLGGGGADDGVVPEAGRAGDAALRQRGTHDLRQIQRRGAGVPGRREGHPGCLGTQAGSGCRRGPTPRPLVGLGGRMSDPGTPSAGSCVAVDLPHTGRPRPALSWAGDPARRRPRGSHAPPHRPPDAARRAGPRPSGGPGGQHHLLRHRGAAGGCPRPGAGGGRRPRPPRAHRALRRGRRRPDRRSRPTHPIARNRN